MGWSFLKKQKLSSDVRLKDGFETHKEKTLILVAPPHISAELPVQVMLHPPSVAGTPGDSMRLSQSREFQVSTR